MSNIILNPVFTGEGRIFINPQGYGGGTKFVYHSSMKIDGLDKSLGDLEPIYVPDPKKYDSFIEVAAIQGSDSRVTSSLSGKLPIDTESPLESLARRKCKFNMQVHYGRCSKPDDFTTYESAIILKDVSLTSYNLSTLVAANPGERALVDETASITLKEFYRIFNQTFINPIPQTSGRVLRVAHTDIEGCADECASYSDGNMSWVALVDATTNDFAVTADGGLTWTQFPNGATNHTSTSYDSILVAAGAYLFWTVTDSSDSTKFYAMDLESVKAGFAATAFELDIATDFIPKGHAVTDNYLYIVGTDATGAADGKIYQIDKNTLAIQVVFTASYGITAIHALDDNTLIIGNSDGEIYTSQVVGFFDLIGNAGGASSTINHVHMHDSKHWVATSGTSVYTTLNAGSSWVRVYEINVSATDAEQADITWYDNLVGYMLFGQYIFKTIDSGTTWKRIYTGFTSTQGNNIVVNPYNPNIIMAVYAQSASATSMVKGFI